MKPYVHVADIPYGDDGTVKVIEAIKDFADRGSMNFEIINLARSIVDGVPERDKIGQADALFYFVKDQIRYIDDPVTSEMVQSPLATLQSGWGDCDDFVTLLAALNQSIGNKIGFVTVSEEDERDYSHVFLALFTDDGLRFYDPIIKESFPGWYCENFGRARLWISPKDYQDLAGFFSSIKKFFKKIGNTFEKIYKELKRVERKIRKERNRLFTKISREFSRWEKKMGIFGKFLVLGSKVGVAVFSGGLLAPLSSLGTSVVGIGSASTTGAFWAGQTVNFAYNSLTSTKTPWTMTDEEWLTLLNLATSIGSIVLSFAPGTQALLLQSVANLISTGSSVLDLERKKQEVEEAIKKAKEIEIRLTFEARVKRELLEKLEADVFLLEKSLFLQKESELRSSLEKEKTEIAMDKIWDDAMQEATILKNSLHEEITSRAMEIKDFVVTTLKTEIYPILGILTESQKKEISNVLASVSI